MIVVKIYMWPGGDRSREHLLSQATIDLQGVAPTDDPANGIVKSERMYRVQILKDTEFGGPGDGAVIHPDAVSESQVWRAEMVRGHRLGHGASARGVWDLVGGALKVLLRGRLAPYKKV